MQEVSVIMPAYNAEKYIEETLNSVLNQTFQDFEIIIVNDGSTDKTEEVIKRFTDPRIKYIYQNNSGPHIARNTGIKNSNSEFIAFLDADDVWYPDKLSKQLKSIKSNPRTGLVFNWVEFIDSNSNTIGHHEYKIYGNFYENLLLQNFVSNGSVPLVRRECFEKAGMFLDTTPAEDWDMWIRIAKYYDFACINEYLVKYRHHSAGISRNVARMEASAITILEREFSSVDKSILYLKKRAYSNKYFYYSDLCRKDNKKMDALFYWFRAIQKEPEMLLERSTRARLNRIFLNENKIEKFKKVLKLAG